MWTLLSVETLNPLRKTEWNKNPLSESRLFQLWVFKVVSLASNCWLRRRYQVLCVEVNWSRTWLKSPSTNGLILSTKQHEWTPTLEWGNYIPFPSCSYGQTVLLYISTWKSCGFLSKPDPGIINWSKHLGLLGYILKTPGGGGGVHWKNWHRNGLYCRLTAGRGSERLFETEHIILWESIATVPHAQTKEWANRLAIFVWILTIVAPEEQKWEALASCIFTLLYKTGV